MTQESQKIEILKKAFKRFIALVHPDRFSLEPEIRKINEKSFKSMMELIDILLKEDTFSFYRKEFKFVFFIQDKAGLKKIEHEFICPPIIFKEQKIQIFYGLVSGILKKAGFEVKDYPLHEASKENKKIVSENLFLWLKENIFEAQKRYEKFQRITKRIEKKEKKVCDKLNISYIGRGIFIGFQDYEKALDRLLQYCQELKEHIRGYRIWVRDKYEIRDKDSITIPYDFNKEELVNFLKSLPTKICQLDFSLRKRWEEYVTHFKEKLNLNIEISGFVKLEKALDTCNTLMLIEDELTSINFDGQYLYISNDFEVSYWGSFYIRHDASSEEIKRFLIENYKKAKKIRCDYERILEECKLLEKSIKEKCGICVSQTSWVDIKQYKEALLKLNNMKDVISSFKVKDIPLFVANRYQIDQDGYIWIKWDFEVSEFKNFLKKHQLYYLPTSKKS